MWLLLWFILILVVFSLWAAPEYWGAKVYPRIRVETEPVDTIVDIGDPVTFRCRFINPTRLPCPRIRLSWVLPEHLRSGSDTDTGQVDIDFYLMPRQSAEVTFTVYAARRGVAEWNEAYLQFTDLLGLRKEYRTVYVHARMVIRPNRKKPIEVTKALTELIGEMRTRRYYSEDPSLFMGLRPYQAGDPLRGISWLATARSGELMVKQFGHTTASKVLILFNGQTVYPFWKTFYKHRIDVMCERLIQIADKLIDNGTSVGLLTNLNDNIMRSCYEPAASGAYQSARLANRMGSITPYATSSMADLIHSASDYAAQDDTILLLTSYWDAEGIRALAGMSRRFKSVLVYNLNWGEQTGTLPGVPTFTEQLSEDEPGEKGEVS
ncbi:hypothetical protein SD71_20330 [Cohnella kolymensis]|uniref:DUF58 domain-containing protein n=1 Tax=Cohnella kolymensis TaxID=1590652 RepID=A0ABR5A1S9_9BACL|nr:DUF58 domain-containing protein [Cohnella kolymensis]KIL34377.1 hypothetical protein SD71_20330 [Cohnella kolymensis]